jgi:hypothetical protein
MLARAVPQPGDQRQDFLEHLPWYRDLGHMGGNVAPVADDVEHYHLRRSPLVHGVDPPAGQVGESGEILGLRQPRGLEAAHLALRRQTR